MRTHVVALACLPLFIISCSRSSAPTQGQLDSSINGRTFTASPDDKFSLRLDLHADGGYQWNCEVSDSTVVTTDGQPSVQAAKDVVGGVAVETFYFRVLRGGQCTMTFNELRGWEHGVAPINTVKFLVVANP